MRRLTPALYSSIEDLEVEAASLLTEAHLMPCDQRQPLLKSAAKIQTYADMKRWLAMPSPDKGR